VVGVLGPAFRFTYPLETEVWIFEPWANVPSDGAAITQNGAIARLRPGVSLDAASSAMAALRDELFPARPNEAPQYRSLTRLEPVTDYVVGDTRASLWLIGGVAVLLLVLTCTTVAGALFVRGASRRADLAVRAALGASRRRLIRHRFIEGAVLAVAGTTAGTLLAVSALPIVRALVPEVIPRGDELRVDAWWLAMGGGCAAIIMVLAALAPAWSAGRVDVADALKRVSKSSSPDRRAGRTRLGLVALQTAMATGLLIGAGLLLTSFWRLSRVPLGFRSDRVLTVETRLLDARYRDRAVIRAFQEDLIARVRALPGVVDAGLTSAVPFRGVDFTYSLTPVGGASRTAGNARMVDDGYFRVMGIDLRRGRLFDAQDTASSDRVIVVSLAFAEAMFGTGDVIGREIDVGAAPARVIGVVGDVRYVAHDREPSRAVYLPRSQNPNELVCIVAELAPGADPPITALRRVMRDLDPALPLVSVTPLDRILDDALAERRFYTAGTTMFAALALTLTTLGLVVVVTRAVVERRREIAIRTALGATVSRVTRLIVGQSLGPVAVGIAAGIAAAAWSARVLTSFLFEVEPRSVAVFAAATAVVALVAFAAAALPAHVAAKASPAAALKTEV
jgi:predicted permease